MPVNPRQKLVKHCAVLCVERASARAACVGARLQRKLRVYPVLVRHKPNSLFAEPRQG
jgi:hypothetical protein